MFVGIYCPLDGSRVPVVRWACEDHSGDLMAFIDGLTDGELGDRISEIKGDSVH